MYIILYVWGFNYIPSPLTKLFNSGDVEGHPEHILPTNSKQMNFEHEHLNQETGSRTPKFELLGLQQMHP